MAVSGRSGSAVIDLTDTVHQAKPPARRRAREDSNGDFVDLVGSPRLGSGRAAAAQAAAAGGEAAAAAAAAAGVLPVAAEIDLTEDDDSQNVPSQLQLPATKWQRVEPRQEQQHQRQQPQQAARTEVRPLQQQRQDEQQPEQAQAQAEQRCDICFDDVQAAFMHKFGACRHSFCLPCLRQYITGKITDRTYPVPCPLPDCKQPISAAECGLVLTPEELATLEKMEAEAAVGDGVRLFCPNKKCSQLLIADDKRADTAMDCPYCQEPLCANCGVDWHKGMTCQAYQAQPGALRSKEDQALLDLAEQSGLKRCPGCGQMVERTMGCSHITCRCGARFCFSCGKRKEKNSSHYCDCKPHAEQWMGGAPGAAGAQQQQQLPAAAAALQARALAQQQAGERALQYAQERQAQRAAQRAARQQLQQGRQAAAQQLQRGRQAAAQQLQQGRQAAQQELQSRFQTAQQQLQAAQDEAAQQLQEAQDAAHERMLRRHAQHQRQHAEEQQQQFQQQMHQQQQHGRRRERQRSGGAGGAAAAAAAAGGPATAAGAPLLPHAPFADLVPGLARLAEELQQLEQELLLPFM